MVDLSRIAVGGTLTTSGSGGGSGSGVNTGQVPTLRGSDNSTTQGVANLGQMIGAQAVTTSAYGVAIPLGYGTVRQAGNMIWASAVQQLVDVETVGSGAGTSGAGKPLIEQGISGSGGSGSVPTRRSLTGGVVGQVISGSIADSQNDSTSPYISFALAFSEKLAFDYLRIFADGSLIFDKTGLKPDISVEGLRVRFYPGSETQLQDPLIVADKGADNTPAYRGICYMVFEDFNTTEFNGNVPNITVEMVYAQTALRPVAVSTQLNGDLTTITSGKFCVDWRRGYAYYGVSGTDGGIRRVNFLAGIEDKQINACDMITGSSKQLSQSRFPAMSVMGDGSLVISVGTLFNSLPVVRLDPDTLIETGRFGTADSSLGNNENGFVNSDRIAALSLRRSDGGKEHYAVIADTNSNNIGIVSIPDMNYVWHLGQVSGETFAGNRIKAIVQGAFVEGAGEVWVLSGPRYNVASSDNNFLYRIRVSEGAAYDAVNSVVTGVIVSLEATFTVADLIPDATDLDLTGGLVYDSTDDSVLLYAREDGSSDRVYIKYSVAQGGIAWRTTANLNSLPSSTIMHSRLRDNRFGWVTGVGDAVLIDTSTGAVLLNHDAPDFSPPPAGIGAFDSRSNSYVAALDQGSSGEPMGRFLFERGTSTEATLASIIIDLAARTDLEASDLDVSDLTTISIPGFLVTSQATARQVIDSLTGLFLVDAFESDFLLRFKQRGSTSVRTISQDDLAFLDEEGEFFRQNRIQEPELPLEFRVTYVDKDADYIQQTHSYQRIVNPQPTMNSRNRLGVELPIALSATVAKQRAQQTLFSAWIERNNYDTLMSWEHIDLDPTDIVTVSLDDGTSYRTRINEFDIGRDFTIEANSIGEEGAYTPTVLGDSGAILQQIVTSIVAVKTVILDIPYLGNVQNVPDRSYSVTTSLQGSYADGQFTRAVLQQADGQRFETITTTVVGMEWGIVTGALADPPFDNPYQTDTVNSVTLRMVDGAASLETVTTERFNSHEGVNRAALIKANGEVEIIRFRDVTQNADGSYTLSYLRRGRRGTDTMTNGHSSGEVFILLRTILGQTFNLDLNERNVAIGYRGLGGGQLLEDGDELTFTSQHRSLMPYAPSNITASLDGSNNIDFAWKRRDRVGEDLRDGTGAQPLSEDSEAYELDILDAPGGNVQRAVTGLTTAAYEYANADIITDFGSVPAQISVRVYQISGQVGRGFTREVTLDVQ